MMRLISSLILLASAQVAVAAGGAGPLYNFDADVTNSKSVQRGAKLFMNYCSGCHSVQYLRYQRLANDHDIPADLLESLMFTTDKPGEHIISAMPAEEAAKWFGQAPPDLSLTARSRGDAWIYSFLKSFYLDPSKANGVNNAQLPGASMPHVLADLQGYQMLSHEEAEDDGHHGSSAPNFELHAPGSLDEKAYDKVVADLTNFLAYAAEPGKADMHSTGLWVLLYLIFILIPVTYAIKYEFWKDVH